MVPKTEVEFRANLGAVMSKTIELKNPSSKAITYDVTLEGSPDFRAKDTQVNINTSFLIFSVASPSGCVSKDKGCAIYVVHPWDFQLPGHCTASTKSQRQAGKGAFTCHQTSLSQFSRLVGTPLVNFLRLPDVIKQHCISVFVCPLTLNTMSLHRSSCVIPGPCT